MSSLRIVMRSSRLMAPLSAIWNASTSTGILMTLALLNISPSRTPAVSPVVRCLTQMPALPGNSLALRFSSVSSAVGCCASNRLKAEGKRQKAEGRRQNAATNLFTID